MTPFPYEGLVLPEYGTQRAILVLMWDLAIFGENVWSVVCFICLVKVLFRLYQMTLS